MLFMHNNRHSFKLVYLLCCSELYSLHPQSVVKFLKYFRNILHKIFHEIFHAKKFHEILHH